jgi:phage-related protein
MNNAEIGVVLSGNDAGLLATINSSTGALGTFAETATASGEEASAGLAVAADGAYDLDAAFRSLLVEAGGAGFLLDSTGKAAAGAGAMAADGSVGFDALGGSMLKSLAPIAGLFVAYEGIKSVISAGISSADEWDSAQSQINNTIANGANATGLNTKQLEAMAEATSAGLPISQASQLAAEQILMTYNTLGKEVYPLVSSQVANVATAMANTRGQTVASATDMTNAAKLLGKGFEDPATGMTALTRVGIKFSEQQTDQVKAMEAAGNLVGAQKQMYSDLSDIVAGKAAASADTYQGKVALLTVAFQNWSRVIVTDVESALEKIGVVLVNVGVFIAKHQALVVALTIVLGILATVITASVIVALVNMVVGFIAAQVAIIANTVATIALGVANGVAAAAIGVAVAAQWLFNGAMEANPIAIIILAIIALIAVVVLIATHWKQTTEIFQDGINFIKTIFNDVVNFIESIWNDVVSFFETVVDSIVGFFQGVWDGIVTVFDAVTGFFKKWGLDILAVIFLPFSIAIGLIIMNWKPISAFFTGIWNGIKAVFGAVSGFFVGIFQREVAGLEVLWNGVVAFFKAIWDGIVAVFTPVIGFFVGLFETEIKGIEIVWNDLVSFFGTVWNGIVAVFIPVISFISGIFQGAWNGIIAIFTPIVNWFSSLFTNAWNGIKVAFGAVGSFFQGVWNTIVGLFTSIGTAVGNAIGGAFQSVVNTIISTAVGIINGFIGAIDTVIDIINHIPGVKVGKLTPLPVPKFATGGIVPGDSPSGDQTLIAANSGEMVLNTQQQSKLFDMLNGNSTPAGGTGAGNVVVTFNNATINLQGSEAVQQFFAMQGRNTELAGMGLTTLTPPRTAS